MKECIPVVVPVGEVVAEPVAALAPFPEAAAAVAPFVVAVVPETEVAPFPEAAAVLAVFPEVAVVAAAFPDVAVVLLAVVVPAFPELDVVVVEAGNELMTSLIPRYLGVVRLWRSSVKPHIPYLQIINSWKIE